MSEPRQVPVVYQNDMEHLLLTVKAKIRNLGYSARPVLADTFFSDPAAALGPETHLVALLEGEALGKLFLLAEERRFSIGIVPRKDSAIGRVLRLPPEYDDAIDLALDATAATPLDLIICNAEPVLWKLTVGDVPFVDTAQQRRLSWADRLQILRENLRRLTGLQPFGVRVETAKGADLKTAVTGIVVVDHHLSSTAGNLVTESISSQDGQVSTIFLAPTSVLAYVSFLVASTIFRWRRDAGLPETIGYIKSRGLRLDLDREREYRLDGHPRRARKLEIEVHARAVVVNLSAPYREANPYSDANKETYKVDRLPSTEARLGQLRERLPFFSTAMEEEFKDLFLMLRENAQASWSYLLLTMLSALLATLGLFQDSAPVVIGAMLLAPLMAPIVSLSMGMLRNDRHLMRDALSTLAMGTLTAFLVAAAVALVIPYEKMTGEIAARLQPTVMDLGVAVISGIAAAYAHAKENVAKSLPGVAIAVALVPPLCVAGIGAGWGSSIVISGALLLFVTNLVGIAIAGTATFMVLGYLPVIRMHRSILFSLALLALLTLPLAYTFHRISNEWAIETRVSAEPYIVNGQQFEMTDVKVIRINAGTIRLSAGVRSNRNLGAHEMQALKDAVSRRLQQPVILEAHTILVL